jgi:hypothetical protein
VSKSAMKRPAVLLLALLCCLANIKHVALLAVRGGICGLLVGAVSGGAAGSILGLLCGWYNEWYALVRFEEDLMSVMVVAGCFASGTLGGMGGLIGGVLGGCSGRSRLGVLGGILGVMGLLTVLCVTTPPAALWLWRQAYAVWVIGGVFGATVAGLASGQLATLVQMENNGFRLPLASEDTHQPS